MNRTLASFVALLALASCNREEKAPEKKAETPSSPQGTTPTTPSAGPDKTAPLPTAAQANEAVEALKAMAGNRAMKLSAKMDAMSLTNAVEQFELDNSRLPLPKSAAKGVDSDTDTGGEEGLMAIIKGMDEAQNPRKTAYIEVREAKFTGGKHTNGLAVDGKTVALYDPWGKPYHMVLDLDLDGKIADPSAAPSDAAPAALAKKVVVWSGGPDGKPDTWQDNVCSWKD